MDNNLFKEDNLYGILARVLGLSQKENGIFVDKDGQKYILTKYGFGPNEIATNAKEIIKLKEELADALRKNVALNKFNEQLTPLNSEIIKQLNVFKSENSTLKDFKEKVLALTPELKNIRNDYIKQNNDLKEANDKLRKEIEKYRNENIGLHIKILKQAKK